MQNIHQHHRKKCDFSALSFGKATLSLMKKYQNLTALSLSAFGPWPVFFLLAFIGWNTAVYFILGVALSHECVKLLQSNSFYVATYDFQSSLKFDKKVLCNYFYLYCISTFTKQGTKNHKNFYHCHVSLVAYTCSLLTELFEYKGYIFCIFLMLFSMPWIG